VKVYFAGVCAAYEPEVVGQHVLVSFHEPAQTALISQNWNVKGWMLDSGAFTAWKKRTEISLDEYMFFIEDHAHLLDCYVALDVIPGQPGRLPTEDEAKYATERTIQNLDRMVAAGFHPVPVYHEGEPIEILDEFVYRGFDLIALGATASRGRPSVVHWLLPIFERYPEQKFHGLAMTQQRLLEWFPFYSVDSTTWLNLQKYGLARNEYLIKNKSPSFYRKVGIASILDITRCAWGTVPSIGGRVSLLDPINHPESK
jgi:hypothetical protein